MPAETYQHNSIYNDLKKIDLNWDKLKTDFEFNISYHEKWQTFITFLEQISAQNTVWLGITNLMTKQHFGQTFVRAKE